MTTEKEKEMDRILVVEDEPYVQGMLEDFLSRSGYAVTVVPTAEKAFISLEEEEIKLILLDKNLPDMSGVEVLSQIRFNNPTLPVIFMTGYPSERSKLMVHHLGISAYFEKPVNLKLLVQTIEKALSETEKPEGSDKQPLTITDITELPNDYKEKEIVLLVTDADEVKQKITQATCADGFLIATSKEVDPVYDFLHEQSAHVLVVDLGLSEGACLALTRWAAKKDPTLSILGLHRKNKNEDETKSFSDSLGIRYMIGLPLDSPHELIDKMSILVKRTRTLRAFGQVVS
jgi:DNA-binding response OmpR family regulator